MRNAILAAAVLVPALAWADDQPYVLRNGRAVSAPAAAPAAPAASNQAIVTANQPSAMGVNAVRATVSAAQAVGAPAPSTPAAQPFYGGGGGSRRGIQRGTAVRRAAPARRATGDSGGSADAPPPYYDKPGALIRTEGQLPVYSDPGNQRTHSVEGGGMIAIDQRKAHDSGRSPGTHWGPPDTRPPVNPTSGAGGNAVTANGPAVPADSGGSGGGAHGNGGGDGQGNGSGGGRGNSLPSGTGFDPAF